MEGISKYFSKKKDLSNKAKGGDKLKNVKKGNSASSTDKTDVIG